MRKLVLKDFSWEVDDITTCSGPFPLRIKAERQTGMHTIDLVGALHGELQSLVPLDALVPLDDLAARLTGRGIPDPLLTLGKLGTAHQLYIPWMQAGYIMVANKQALPYLPSGADINALSYDQLATWASTLQQKTGKRLLGFPAGPHGLMHRFFEGLPLPVLYRRGRGSVPLGGGRSDVDTVRVAMEKRQSELDQLQFHRGASVSRRCLDRLRPHCPRARRPAPETERICRLPRSRRTKGRGYMPLLVGLAVVKGAPDMAEAMALIDYLTQPKTQITLARTVGFFPVVNAKLPPDLDPGLRMGADAIAKMQSAKDALPALPPIGFGQRDAEFDRVFLETFQLIVLRGQKPRSVLDREAGR